MKIRIANARRLQRARPRAAAATPPRPPPPAPAPPPVPLDRTSVAGEEDPGAALDAPGDSSHG